MNYFDGINFIGYGNSPGNTSVHKIKQFDGYYGIQYNHSGRLDFAIGDSPHTVVEGAWAFFSYPGPSFYYAPPAGEKRHHCYLCFNGPRVEAFIKSGLMPIDAPSPLFRIVHAERFLSTLTQVMEFLDSPNTQNRNRAVLLLEDALLQLHETPTETFSIGSHLKKELRLLMEEIQSTPELEWNFVEEAKSLNISYPHFRRLFKQLTGAPPNRFVIDCRLQLAKRFLTTSSLAIGEIGSACGFSDEFYFSRIFKKYSHISPLRYRKEFSH